MFQMTIEDVIRIGNNISFGGPCENRHEFTNQLTDDDGNMYDTYIPLGKDLVVDDSQITLCLQSEIDESVLIGRVLRSIA